MPIAARLNILVARDPDHLIGFGADHQYLANCVLLGPHAFCEGLVDDHAVAAGIEIPLLEFPALDYRNAERVSKKPGVTRLNLT